MLVRKLLMVINAGYGVDIDEIDAGNAVDL